MPPDYSGDTLLCKQCQVSHMSPPRPPDKTDSASHIPSPVCPRLCLHLVPIGSNDRVWALVTSNSQHKASEWDSGCHYRGSWLPPAWAYLILCFLGAGGGVSSSKCHTLLYSPSLSSSPKVFYCDGFFIIHIGTSCWLLLKNPPRINLPHINTIYTHICTHMHFLITHTHTGHTLMPVVEHMWRQGY